MPSEQVTTKKKMNTKKVGKKLRFDGIRYELIRQMTVTNINMQDKFIE